mgnify:CR=1 FL=1
MRDFTENEKTELKQFFTACNEMIDGRFILSDIKISKILTAIANSTVLYDVVAKCMVGFNFRTELLNAKVGNKVNGGYFVLPSDEKKIIALVFCLLLEVDKGKMNLQSFVNENFYSTEGYNISYSNFAINVLVPFKNSFLNILQITEDGEPIKIFSEEVESNQIVMDGLESEPKHESEPNNKILYANLMRALNQLYSAVTKEPRLREETREEVVIVIKGIFEAIKIENIKILNALVIPLEHLIGNVKQLRPYYSDFKESLVAFYY